MVNMAMWWNSPRPPCFTGTVRKNLLLSLENTGSWFCRTQKAIRKIQKKTKISPLVYESTNLLKMNKHSWISSSAGWKCDSQVLFYQFSPAGCWYIIRPVQSRCRLQLSFYLNIFIQGKWKHMLSFECFCHSWQPERLKHA